MTVYASRTEHLFIKSETTYGSEAGSTDGSDYTWVPAAGTPSVSHEIQILEAPVQTGRTMRNVHFTGSDKASVTFSVWNHALSGASGHATALGSNDAIDLLLLNVFGQVRGVTGSNASTASLTTVNLANGLLQDLLPIHGTSSISPARVQWAQSRAESGGTQTISPSLETIPTTPLVYGRKQYFQNHTTGTQGVASLSMVYVKGAVKYLLKGGRISSLALEAPRGGLSQWKVGMTFDSIIDDSATKTALPTIDEMVQPVLKSLASPVWINGQKLSSVDNIALDLGIKMKEIPAQEAGNGRSEMVIESIDPMLTIEPCRNSAYFTDFKTAKQQHILVQVGSGIPTTVKSTFYVPTAAINFDNAQMVSYEETDKDGTIAYKLVYKLADQGTFVSSSTVQARGFSYARC